MKKDKKKKIVDSAMYFGITAVFLTVISLLILAITSTPDDEMLMVCWRANGMPQYTNNMSSDDMICDEPTPIKWHSDHLLVAVTNNGSLLRRNQVPQTVEAAISLVNRQLGIHLTLTDNLLAADIVIDWHAAYEIRNHIEESPLNDASGYCEHIRLPSGRLTANMVARTQGTVELERNLAVHELGHCVGLAHSDFGIMRSVLQSGEEPFVMFSDSQKEMIRALYPD